MSNLFFSLFIFGLAVGASVTFFSTRKIGYGIIQSLVLSILFQIPMTIAAFSSGVALIADQLLKLCCLLGGTDYKEYTDKAKKFLTENSDR